ncbi:phage tail tape measure protein [Mongoliitalea lutea]|uniref:Phage tail tape measure protein n=1 Tax=Mongoliitalea lutea TaxID=849756 RepID=A0A8J3CYU3_9BACT|nr:phage tail tape measure protein [Mongoliitalea lutea]GHB44340.1 phage tail tape measure protein [Mongoliitalea lutea]
MGKKLRDEDLVLNIIVNGDKGRKEIGELERAIKDTNNELKTLEKQEKQMRADGKKDTEAYRAVTQAIKQKNDALAMAESRLKQLRSQVDINKMSLIDLKREMNNVRRLRDISSPLSEEWRKHDQRLREVTARYRELNGQAMTTGSSIKSLASNFNHYIGVITAGFASAFAAISGVRKAISDFAEFDDKVADVMKTTNLTRAEVIELNEELKRIDTRTAQNDLLGLTRVAGKLGIQGTDNLLGFVRASDQISVALSEDLGGDVEAAITAVGKLVDIFKISDEFPLEQALLKVGSTINELGMASTANEGYIVEFTRRMAGVGPLAKMTITDLMGMAATLDSLGQTSEVSTTALSKLFLAMAKNADVYAKYANMPVDAFKELIDADANEAFLRVLEGVKENSEGLTDLASTLGDLGQDGGRVIGVLGSLANNTDKLREQQILANKAFEEGTSLTEEFGIKNETAQAKLEKARKGLQNLVVELGEKLMPVMAHSISGFNMLIRILSVLVDFFLKYGKHVAVLTTLFVAYNAILWAVNLNLKENILVTKLKVFWDNAMIAGTQLLAAVQMLLAGNIKGATQAMRVFNSVAKLNPFVLLASVVIAAGLALYAFSKQSTAAEKAQEKLNDVTLQAEKSVVKERLEVEKLIKVAQNKALTDEARTRALQKLNEISPQYFGNLNLETVNTEAAKKATDAYIESLLKKAKIQAAEEQLVELEKKRLEAIMNGQDASLSFGQEVKVGLMRVLGMHTQANMKMFELRKQNREDFEKDMDIQSRILTDFIKENSEKMQQAQSGSVGLPGSPTAAEITTIESLEAKLKELQDQRKRINVENLDELRKNAGEQKKIQDELAKYEIKSAAKVKNETKSKDKKDLERELERQQEFRRKVLESQLSLIDQEKLAFERRLQEAGIFGKKREEMTAEEFAVLQALTKEHYAKLDKLDADALKIELQRNQDNLNEQLRELRIKHNEEFKSIKTMEQARAALQGELSNEALLGLRNMRQAQQELDKMYRRQEEKLLREHLENLQSELIAALDSGNFSGVNLSDSVLSEDEKDVLIDRLNEVREKLSELGLGSGTEIAEDRGLRTSNVDLLGFTPDDWSVFFDNLEAGRMGVEEMVFAAQALGNVWAQYNQFVAAGERRQMQEFERNTRERQDLLKRQLDANIINQDMYNQQSDKLNADLDKKRAVYERNQAKRERNVALMSAIVNTAAAVAKSLPNLLLAKIVGGFGALQIGAILKTPLPEIPGVETGGSFEDVIRSQDKKMFRAKMDFGRRGYVDRPTVIVGENGSEFVANAQAVNNPTVKPVLDAIDTAQRNGSIDSLNLFRILEQNRQLSAAIPGRESGGFVGNTSPGNNSMSMGNIFLPEMMDLLRKNQQLTNALIERLKRPIKADVSLIGKGSLEETQSELTEIQKSANI